jgi:hypothetical protein
MLMYQQFQAWCACGAKTSEKYAREHGGRCKRCVTGVERMRTKERFPLRFIRTTHPHWDRVNEPNWFASNFKKARVAIASLVGVQAYVTINGVADADDTAIRPIYVVEVQGVKYIRDGHHRVTRAIKRGRKTVVAEVLVL